jgi:hypothetical protein
VEVAKALMRAFSYLFHGLLALFLIAVSVLALVSSGGRSLQLGMLPWSGVILSYILFFGAAFGLVTLLLALAGKVRVLFFIWALAVAGFLIKGYVFSSYHFGPGSISTAVYLLVASLVALLGAWFQMRQEPAATRFRRY